MWLNRGGLTRAGNFLTVKTPLAGIQVARPVELKHLNALGVGRPPVGYIDTYCGTTANSLESCVLIGRFFSPDLPRRLAGNEGMRETH